MKYSKLLKILLYISLLLIIILFCYIYMKTKVNIVENKEIFTEETLKKLRTDLVPVIKNIIGQKEFKDYFMIKSKYGISMSHYYEMIICHPLFVECFLDVLMNKLSLTSPKPGPAESVEILNNLLFTYISTPWNVLDDIITKSLSLPANFNIGTKQDIILLLKEYGKLLTMSTEKRELVTSDAFIERFISTFNMKSYIILESYSDTNLIQLKKAYYNYVMSNNINEAKIVGDILITILEPSLKIVIYALKWSKEHLLLLNPEEVLLKTEDLIELFRIYNISFNYLEYAYPPLANNPPIIYVEDHIVTPQTMIAFEAQFAKDKSTAMNNLMFGSLEISL